MAVIPFFSTTSFTRETSKIPYTELVPCLAYREMQLVIMLNFVGYLI